MMSPEQLRVVMLFMGLMVACEGPVLPAGKNNLHHDPYNPNMLQCPKTTIEGKDGDTVILSCSTKNKMDISHEQVEWLFEDPTTGKNETVHRYFQRKDYLHDQRDDFRHRTSLFKNELSSGNCSLRLKVNTAHSGRYFCSVAGHQSCAVTLKVLQCPKTTIEGNVGDTVILPCSTKNKMDLSLELFEWLFEDPTTGKNETVHMYYQHEDYLQTQSDDFRQRTSLFKEELSSGNCSLRLKVNTALGGRYFCCVVTDGKPHCCPVVLKVLPKGQNNTSHIRQEVTPSPDNPNSGTDGQTNYWAIVGGVVGFVVVFVVVVVVIVVTNALVVNLRRRRPKHLCSGKKPNTSHIYLEVSDQAQQPPQDQEI